MASENPKIVLSYRRTDAAMAGRIFDRLAQHFGKSSLFIDIDDVPFGVDFRKHIDDALKTSDLLIAVVGQNWVGTQTDGKTRILNAADPVRVELETALRRDLNVLPVLLEGAPMPDPEELPESIRDFAFRNALEVESGRDFNVHIDRLIRAIEQLLGVKTKVEQAHVSPLISQAPQAKTGWPQPLLLGIAGLLLAGSALGVWWYWPQAKDDAEPDPFAELCDDIKRVVAEARTQFTEILGPESSGAWTARIQLPGWDDCTVSDFTYKEITTRYYSCRLPPNKNRTEIEILQNKFAAFMKPCLGSDFVERRTSFSDQTTHITYEMGPNDPTVRLRVSYYDDMEDYFLRLDVDAPQPSADGN